jgi:mandelate racemase
MNALGLMAPEAAADEAEKLLENGFRALKQRLGHATLAADLAALRAVRKRLPDDVKLMVDFNQALSVEEALERGRAIDGEGVFWIEEPIRHDDYRGCAELARELATPVQIGENFSLPEQMAEAIAAERAVPMSSHLFPEASAHLLAVTPTCHFLEYVDWADAILAEPLAIVEGAAVIPERPGTGVVWDEKAVERYRMG